jgi:hypothetical protein
MYFNRSLNIDGARVVVYFISLLGDKLHYAFRIHFRASNNIAKYEAALHGLHIVIELGSNTSRCTETPPSSSTSSTKTRTQLMKRWMHIARPYRN